MEMTIFELFDADMEESPKIVISTLSCRPVSHTCSLEYDDESATYGSKSLSSSKIPQLKTSLSG